MPTEIYEIEINDRKYLKKELRPASGTVIDNVLDDDGKAHELFVACDKDDQKTQLYFVIEEEPSEDSSRIRRFSAEEILEPVDRGDGRSFYLMPNEMGRIAVAIIHK